LRIHFCNSDLGVIDNASPVIEVFEVKLS
jgi:hypothetical protein